LRYLFSAEPDYHFLFPIFAVLVHQNGYQSIFKLNNRMEVHKLTYNPFQENTYVVSDKDKNCVIIDPGCYFQEEKEALKSFIVDNEFKVLALFNTHAHLDHIMGNAFVKRTFEVELYLHKADEVTLNMGDQSAQVYGLELFETSPQPDHFIEEGERLKFGGIEFDVIFAPGHSPGHVVFYNGDHQILINGDVLFRGSYGRVDLPGGDFDTLKNSIQNKLFNLPDATLVYTGHGPETRIGDERKSNPINW
jgi:glyoxylase-like metal-dependent hydrolase (beta-lactamase superfamily II)